MNEEQIHIHVHVNESKIDSIEDKIISLTVKINKIMADLKDIQAQNDALIAAVKDEDTVIDGAVTLITGFGATLQAIKDQLAAAIASNDPVAMQTVADSLGTTITDINTKKDALAAAVASVPA